MSGLCSTVSQSAPARLSDHDRPVAAHRWILAAAWGDLVHGILLPDPPLLPAAADPESASGLSEGDLATLTAVGVGMTGVGGLLFGWMSDRLGRRLSMAVSIAAFSLGNAACAFAPGFGWLLAARALAGLGVGGSWGAGQAMLGETFPPALRGRYGAIAQTGAPAGLGLATIVGSFVAPVLGWRTVFLLSAAPVLVLLAWSRLPESDLWLEHRRRLRRGRARRPRPAADPGPARGRGPGRRLPARRSSSPSSTCRPTGSPSSGCRATSRRSAGCRSSARGGGR